MTDQSPALPEENLRPWIEHYAEGIDPEISLFEEPLFHFLDMAAEKNPSTLACVFENTKITYKQLQKQAEILAASLRHMGLQPGDRVAIMLPNIPQAIIAFWAVLKAGGTVVMINPLYMEKEIVHHLRDSSAKYFIMLDLLWPKIYAMRTQLPIKKYLITTIADALSFPLNFLYKFKQKRSKSTLFIPYDTNVIAWKNLFTSKERYSTKQPITAESIALLQYTGGTTGVPKGVMLTHQNIGTNCLQILNIIKVLRIEELSFVAILPFFHVYGLSVGLIIPTATMSTVFPLPRYVPHDVLALIKKHKPSVLLGAPSIYASLLQQKDLATYDLQCVQLCISGSAPLAAEHFHRFQEITGATILEGYGLTEASPITHLSPLSAENHKIGSIGLPLPGTDARIVDMEGGSLTLPPGKLGELVIRGPQVMSGYWNRPDATASALRNGWLYTGDLATMDEEGFFHIVDRKKDMVIVGGYNVYPREIDELLLEHPAILDAVAVGIPDATRGEIIKVFIVLKPKMTLSRTDIIAWCRSKLASYKVPRAVEFCDDLPKTIVGKVLRRVLREKEMEKLAGKNEKIEIVDETVIKDEKEEK